MKKILRYDKESDCYEVSWDGQNPDTGMPWSDSWISRESFKTQGIIDEWESEQKVKKR